MRLKITMTLLLLVSVATCYGFDYITQATAVHQGAMIGTGEKALPRPEIVGRDKSENYQLLEWYGAKGDGTDDTAAFLAAHQAIQAKGYGGIILRPGKTYGISGISGAALFKLSNLEGYFIDAAGGATIKDLKSYINGENAIAFQFSNCKNIRIPGGLKLISQANPGKNNTFGLTWFKFLHGCANIDAEVEVNGGLHGFHFYRKYGEPQSSSTSNIRLNIAATNVYYPELHERSGDNVVTKINATNCGRGFFIFGGGNNVKADITTKNSFGFLISSDSQGNGAENISINYRDRNSDKNNPGAGRSGLQFYNQQPAVFRNISINIDVKNPPGSPFSDSFFINKVSDTRSQDKTGRGHKLYGLEISGVSEQVNNRKHINTYGEFASPDLISNVRIRNFKTSGHGSDILLSFGSALADSVTIENVTLPKNMIKVLHSTGKAIFVGYSKAETGSR